MPKVITRCIALYINSNLGQPKEKNKSPFEMGKRIRRFRLLQMLLIPMNYIHTEPDF